MADTESPPLEPVLDVDDIQGDSLAGFRKNHELFTFFEITDLERFRETLRSLIPDVSSLREVAGFNKVYRELRQRRGAHRTGLAALWINIAFTSAGLTKLAPAGSVERFADESFKLGMAARARGGLLGDVPPAAQLDATSGWRFGGTATPVDGVLLIAADNLRDLEARAQAVAQDWFGDSGPARQVWSEICHVRSDLPGHEHFGFRDGISQPGVRGRAEGADDAFVTPRYIDARDERSLRYARPGQRLIWPGEFVLGLPTQQLPPNDDLQPGPDSPAQPPWTRNGSFLVVRRLNQDVAGFRSFAQAAADAVRKAGFDVEADRLLAMIVGRWPSGAPVVRTPAADDPSLGKDDFAANDFGFEAAWGNAAFQGPPELDPGKLLPLGVSRVDRYAPPQADPSGLVCPHAAHVRKINPRDQETDIGGADNTLHRRIIRRGVPFGQPWTEATSGQERGLMFACYQASIANQFEFLTTDWVNRPNAPRNDPGGIDMLIAGKQLSSRSLVLSRADGSPLVIPVDGLTDRPWISATGGGYFFAPSISALRGVLTTELSPGKSRT